MDTRKLVRLGNSSFAIALPIEWVRGNKLDKGDIIYIEKNSNSELVILPTEKKVEVVDKEIILKTENKDIERIIAEISSAYMNNYNIMIIEDNFQKKRLSEIKEILGGMIGMEIIKQSNNKIVVRDILDAYQFPISEVLRKMDNIIRGMFEELIEAINENKVLSKKAAEIAKIDLEVNKLYFLSWKLIRKGLADEKIARSFNTDSLKLSSMQWMSMNLESIGDEIKRVARFVSQGDQKEIKKIKLGLIKLILLIQRNYTDAMTAYYKTDKDLALEVASKNDESTIEECDKFSQKNPDPVIARIVERLKAIQGSVHYITRSVSF